MAKKSDQPTPIAQNKKARFDYFIEERFERSVWTGNLTQRHGAPSAEDAEVVFSS